MMIVRCLLIIYRKESGDCIMQIGNDNIREYLLKKGFMCIDYYAQNYVLKMKASKHVAEIEFGIDIVGMKAYAKYPDYAYIAKNPYSKKDTIIEYSWSANDSDSMIIANLEKFFDDVIRAN